MQLSQQLRPNSNRFRFPRFRARKVYARAEMWRYAWRDPEEKFTFAVCAVALVIVIAKVWFE